MSTQFNDKMSIQELIFILQWLRAEASKFYRANEDLNGRSIFDTTPVPFKTPEAKEEHKRMTDRITVLEKMLDGKCTDLAKTATKAALVCYEEVPAVAADFKFGGTE